MRVCRCFLHLIAVLICCLFTFTTAFAADTSCADGTGYAAIGNNGNQDYTNGGKKQSDYGLTENGTWGTSFSYGDITGKALCLTTRGEWAKTGTPDESEKGRYCWCQIDGYTPTNGSKKSLSGAWVFNSVRGSASDCARDCAFSCGGSVRANGEFRSALLGSAGVSAAICEADTYTITYELNGGRNNPANPTSYTIESAISLNTPTRSGYTFNGWYTTPDFSDSAVTSILRGSTGNKTFYAKWTANTITCPVGTYLPANTTQCTECPTNSYCAGGTNSYSETDPQGIEQCPTGYSLSEGGATSADDCYRQCSASDVPHLKSGGTFTGMFYSNNTNACEPVNDASCADGYHYTAGSTGLNVDTGIDGTGYAVIGNNGNQDYTSGGKTQSDYNLTANGTWGTSFSYGDITGKAICSTTKGKGLWMAGADKANSPEEVTVLPDGTFASDSTGQYCWCQIDGFTPVGGSKQSLSGAWVFGLDDGSAGVCADVCADDCAYYLQYGGGFRAALLGSVGASAAICEPDVYTITYELNGGTNNSANPKSYTIESETITLGNPTKTGSTFKGWYTTPDFSGDKVTKIPTGSTGDKTLYAKWWEQWFCCSAEKYLPANTTKCVECPTGSYCGGGCFTFDETNTGGITSCPAEYPLSASGATSANECYRQCTASDVAHSKSSGAITGMYYSNNTNVCEPVDEVSCADGYHYKAGSAELVDVDIDGTGYAVICHNGEDYTRDGKTQSDYGLTANGTWGTSFSYGDITGKALCSSSYQTGGTLTIGTPDESESGSYCWCQIDGYTPVGGFKQSLSGAWMFDVDDYGTTDGCTQDCAISCASDVRSSEWVRTVLFRSAGIMGSSPAICEPDVYTITYELNGGATKNNRANPKSYTIESETITLFEPSRKNSPSEIWIFNGWVDDSGNTITEIPTGSTGDITLTAQWTQDTPTPEFTITTTEMSAGTEFKFSMSAMGEFTVDWGDGNVETITRTDTTDTEYTHRYTNGGTYTIGFSGQATGYASSVKTSYKSSRTIYEGAAISFYNNKNVAGISGSLGAIFGTLSSGTNIQPRFYHTFSGNTNLKGSITHDLFAGISGAPASYMFSGTFSGCSGLTGSIPHDLFAGISGAPAEHMFDGTFSSCWDLSGEIPHDLFAGISGAPASYMFNSTFSFCRVLTGEIPHDLFAGISGEPAEAMFYYTFGGCRGLSGEIPHDLFAGISGAPAGDMFNSTFSGCSGLTGSIPHDLFAGISGSPAGYMFNSTFQGCSGLSGSIPHDLFAGISGAPAEYMFEATFYGCSGLSGEIPHDLFAGISGAPASDMFSCTFYGCSGLTGSIPEKLFGDITSTPAQYMFAGTFDGCSGLTGSIPKKLFGDISGDSALDMFYGTFYDCSGLTGYIPYELFSGITGSEEEDDFTDTTWGANQLMTICPENTYQATINTSVPFNSLDGHAICASCPDGTISPAGSTSIEQCVVLTATITYDYTNGGSGCANETYTLGIAKELTCVPRKEGYTFVGWYDSASGGNKITQITALDTGDKTFYAQWKELACQSGYEVRTFFGAGLDLDSAILASSSSGNNAANTWTATVSGTLLSGISSCAANSTETTEYNYATGVSGDILNEPINTENASDNLYCYCKLTEPEESAWVFAWRYSKATGSTGCSKKCANQCAYLMKNKNDSSGERSTAYFREALYSTTNRQTVCEPISYSITYELNAQDSVVENDNPESYTVETLPVLLNNPSRENFDFAGWTDTNGNLITEIPTDSTGNITLTAQWTPIEYTIAYELNGGTNNSANPTSYTIESETITFGIPTKEGYDFNGWVDDSGNTITEIPTGSTGDKTLYAQWTPVEYNIRYNLDGGTNYEGAPETYTIESETITFGIPTKEDYDFNGWVDNEGNTITEIPTGSTGDKELTVVWTVNMYEVYYETNGGTECSPEAYSTNTEHTLMCSSIKPGYVFDGWYKDADLSGNKITKIGAEETGDKTFYAKWRHYCDSGKYFHIWNEEAEKDEKICLTSKQITHPALAVRVNNKMYYLEMSKDEQDKPINYDSNMKFHIIDNNGTIYNVHDSSVIQ